MHYCCLLENGFIEICCKLYRKLNRQKTCQNFWDGVLVVYDDVTPRAIKSDSDLLLWLDNDKVSREVGFHKIEVANVKEYYSILKLGKPSTIKNFDPNLNLSGVFEHNKFMIGFDMDHSGCYDRLTDSRLDTLKDILRISDWNNKQKAAVLFVTENIEKAEQILEVLKDWNQIKQNISNIWFVKVN